MTFNSVVADLALGRFCQVKHALGERIWEFLGHAYLSANGLQLRFGVAESTPFFTKIGY
jgi:hypothetical protein